MNMNLLGSVFIISMFISILVYGSFKKAEPEIVERILVKPVMVRPVKKSEKKKKVEDLSECKKTTDTRVVLNSALRDDTNDTTENYTLNLNETFNHITKLDIAHVTVRKSMDLIDSYKNLIEYTNGSGTYFIKIPRGTPTTIDQLVAMITDALSQTIATTPSLDTLSATNLDTGGVFTITGPGGGSSPVNASVGGSSTSIVFTTSGSDALFSSGQTSGSFNYSFNEVCGINNNFNVSTTIGGTTSLVNFNPLPQQQLYIRLGDLVDTFNNINVPINSTNTVGDIDRGPEAFAIVPVENINNVHYNKEQLFYTTWIPTTPLASLRKLNVQWLFLAGNVLRPCKFKGINNSIVLDITHSLGRAPNKCY